MIYTKHQGYVPVPHKSGTLYRALVAMLCHLVQQDSKLVEKPICHASKTSDRALAVVWSTDLLRTLLLGHQFVHQIDHSALKQ